MTLSNDEINKLKDILGAESNYNFNEIIQKLVWSNGLKESDDKKTIYGMLAVYYQFRNSPEPAISAAQWRITKDINDDQGMPGQIYFDLGFNLSMD